jgi:hypothetical protein
LTGQVSSLSKTNKEIEKSATNKERGFEVKLREKDLEHKEAIAVKESEIKDLQAGKVKELENKEREFEAALKKAKNKFQVEQNLYRSYRSEKDQIFKRSITWRIGSAFVVPYILIRDFIKHPYKFCREPGKYFRRVYYHHYPRSKPALSKIEAGSEGEPINGRRIANRRKG